MKKQILLILFTLLLNSVFAAYLKNVPARLTQPDGTVIHCFVTGDEFHRRVHDKNDYTIVQDPASGYYVYAELHDNRLIPTSHRVGKADPAESSLMPGYDLSPAESKAKRQNALKSAGAVTNNATRGDFNNIVISIRFADQEPTSLTKSHYEALFNSQHERSLKYYFDEVSNNQLNVSSFFFPVPENDKVFEYQDSHPRRYYSLYNDAENPEGYRGDEESKRESTLLKNAVESVAGQIEASGINFDANNDGIIDNIIFILQGDVDGWGNILWPEKSSLINQDIRIGGKKAGTYNKNLTGWLELKVICHEFFHSLGAPDLYRYTHAQGEPVGAWDIMGITEMQHTTTYMKWRYGKWFDTIPEITEPGTYTLEPVSRNPFACYKIPAPENSNEYFMVEYRKREGLLESMLPWDYEEGLIIYRIHPDALHGNSGGPPDEVFVFRPDGDAFNTGQIGQASFSADFSRTAFNNETNPPCVLSSGNPGWIGISAISFAGSEISFKFNKINPLPKPPHFEVTERNGGIEFTWDVPPPGIYSLQGYNIYLEGDDDPLNASPITGTHYPHVIPGQEPYYVFNLVARYNEGESDPLSVVFLNSKDSFLSDSLALAILYNQCGGPDWINNENWLEGPLDTWYGVTVEDRRVTSLYLAGSWHEEFGLNYTLPEELGVLSALRNLNLSYNALTDEIPVALYNLKELLELDLTANHLTGELPGNLGNLWKLESLLLGNNLLYGVVPPEISKLENLERLNLSNNYLAGPVLDHLSSFTRLRELELNNNLFGGTVAGEVGKFKNLETLNLSKNRFSGELPDEIGELTELIYFALDDNQFYGAVPQGVANFRRIHSFSITNNKFEAVPALQNSTFLEKVALDENRFTFEDLEPEKFIFHERSEIGLSYNDQAKIGKEETKYALPGEPYTLSVYCGGNDNQYQWFKNGMPVSDVSDSPDFVVEKVVEGNNGKYFCRITNPGVWGLTIESHPANLTGRDILMAHAGNDFGAEEGSVVTLNGTGSHSPRNAPLSYRWMAPEGIVLRGTDEAQPHFVAPEVSHDKAYIFTLVVNDGTGDSAPDEVAVTIRDGRSTPPVAVAGPHQAVEEFDLVFLDGSSSYDPGGGELTYRWTAPEGIELNGAGEVHPSFTAPEVVSDTTFVFILVVTSGTTGSEPDEVAVTVRNGLQVPVAHAGFYQVVEEGETVLLDGSRSHVKGNGKLTYRWTAPEGIELSGADEAYPFFTAPEVISDTDFSFILVVIREGVESEPDKVVVTVQNKPQPPVANAGPDQTVRTGETVFLDGTGSAAADADTLFYQWRMPQGISLDGQNEPLCSFTAPSFDADTTLTFYLVVTNTHGYSDTASVNITISYPLAVGIPAVHPGNMNVYPNPSTGIINIRLKNSVATSQFRVRVTALSGAIVTDRQLSGSDNFRVDLSGQPAGIYFIHLLHEKESYFQKLILN